MSERRFEIIRQDGAPPLRWHVESVSFDNRPEAEALCALANAAPELKALLERALADRIDDTWLKTVRAALAACEPKETPK
jgi:hypothetical protein